MNRRDHIEADAGWPEHPEDVLDGYELYELHRIRADRAARPQGDPRNRGWTLRQLTGMGGWDERLDEDGYAW